MLSRPPLDQQFVRIGQGAIALAAFATLAGFAGGFWWAFDLFAHFRPQYLLAALVLTVLFALTRRPGWVAGALAVAIINAVPVVSLYLPPPEATGAAPAAPLRVMSFNVFNFNREYERTLRYVQTESPDVLVLLEVSPAWLPALSTLARQYPYQWIDAGDAANGIAVLSRVRPSEVEQIELAARRTPAYLLTFAREDTTLAVLGTHLSWPLGRRVSETRNAQLAAIARLARAHPGPLVVVGDLNITPFSGHFTRMLRDGGLRRCAPTGLLPTWPARFVPFYIPIDHCLASTHVRAWNFRVGEYLGSDHYPISVEVAADPSPPRSRP
jgi:endonuclease/exonuclease/phosphatase (EEP) superfamily protein YafD